MKILDRDQVKIKLGTYGVATSAALGSALWVQKVRDYRRQLSARMMALDPPSLAKRLAPGTYHVSRKIDGEFTVLVWTGEEIFSLNPGGTVRVGLSFLEEAKSRLQKAGVGQTLIAGELYLDLGDGSRTRVHDLLRVVRSPESQEDLGKVKYAIFDLVQWEEEGAGEMTLASVQQRIQSTFGEGELIHPVEAVYGDLSVVQESFAQWVEGEGGEGVVTRSEEAGWYKIKPRHTLDVVVVGFTEGEDEREGLLHDLLVAVMRDEGTLHLVGRVGGGFTDAQRRDFLSDLKGMEVESEYHEISSDRVAYRMVRPEWVVEISCLDLISESTRGESIPRMVLRWDESSAAYCVVRPLPSASVISPQFIRLRDDKEPVPEDVPLRQITQKVPVSQAEKNSLTIVYPASEILRRQVHTKNLRGSLGVRKLVLWRTNKEKEDPKYPAYVLHGTDFSPNRKAPLKREIRVSNSLEQIEELWESLATKYFVKGWEEVVEESPN